MAVSSYLVALALAAVQPAAAESAAAQPAAVPPAAQAPAPPGDTAALIDLFERVCLANGDAPTGFAAVQWSDFPEPLRLMNTYGHGGTFLRSETPSLIYIARTEGSGHMTPGIETRCGVAARGVDLSQIVSHLAERTGARPNAAPVSLGDVSMHMLIGDRYAVTIYGTQDNWVIVRNMGIMIPADMLRRRDRRRRGDRN
jgi:hypothetical protein